MSAYIELWTGQPLKLWSGSGRGNRRGSGRGECAPVGKGSPASNDTEELVNHWHSQSAHLLIKGKRKHQPTASNDAKLGPGMPTLESKEGMLATG